MRDIRFSFLFIVALAPHRITPLHSLPQIGGSGGGEFCALRAADDVDAALIPGNSAIQ